MGMKLGYGGDLYIIYTVCARPTAYIFFITQSNTDFPIRFPKDSRKGSDKIKLSFSDMMCSVCEFHIFYNRYMDLFYMDKGRVYN